MKKVVFILGLLAVTFSACIAQNPNTKTAPTNLTQYGVWEGGKWKYITGAQLDSFVQASATRKYMKYATVTTALPSTGNLRYSKSLVRNTTTGVFTVVDSLGNAFPISSTGFDIDLSNYATHGYVDTALLNYVIPDNTLTEGMLKNNSVTATKLGSMGASAGHVLTYDGGVWTTALPSSGATGSAGGDLTGTYPNPTIANNAVTESKIYDNSVTLYKIRDGAVTTNKLASGSVTAAKIANSSINRDMIIDGEVVLTDINTGGATNGQVISYDGTNVVWSTPSGAPSGTAGGDLGGTYPNPSIANGAVITARIANDAVTASKIADGSVITGKLGVSAVDEANITNGAVTVNKIGSGAVSLAKISPTGATSGQVIGYDGSSIAWISSTTSTGAAGGSLTGTYPNPTLATNSVGTAQIADGSLPFTKMDYTGASTGKVATYNGFTMGWATPSSGDSTVKSGNPSTSNDVKLGYLSLQSGYTGNNFNTAIGYKSGSVLSGTKNTLLGYQTMYNVGSGSQNTAIGYVALTSNSGNNNVAVGANSGAALSSGANNALLGSGALQYPSGSSSYNTAIGYNSLNGNAGTLTGNTSIGASAGYNQSSGIYNSVVGANALYNSTSGSFNVAIGDSAGYNLTTGSRNIIIGKAIAASSATASDEINIGGIIKWVGGAFSVNGTTITGGDTTTVSGSVTVGSSVKLGYNSLNNYALTNYNTAIGNLAMKSATTAINGVMVGSSAGTSITTGAHNTAIGFQAMSANTTGDQNVAIGTFAMKNTNGSATNSVAIGANSLGATTSGGVSNTALGNNTMYYNTGSGNTAVGQNSMFNNLGGGNNTAVGQSSLIGNTTGSANVAVGQNVMQTYTTGTTNTAIGTYALRGNGTSTGSYNTAIGAYSGFSNTGGYFNTFVGDSSGYTNSTGNYNIAIGRGANLPSPTANSQLQIGNWITGSSVGNLTLTASSTVTTGDLKASGNLLRGDYVETSTNYTVAYGKEIVAVSNEANNVTITFPSASAYLNRVITVKRLFKSMGANSTGSITITPTAGVTSQAGNIELLDGTFSTSSTLGATNTYAAKITYYSNGSEWIIK